MTKENFIAKAKDIFTGKTLDIVLAQIEEFFKLKQAGHDEPIHKYEIGDDVNLQKGTLMHGIAMHHSRSEDAKTDVQVFDILARDGIISSGWTFSANYLVSYCASFYRQSEDKKLGKYIKEYSGLTFRYRCAKNIKKYMDRGASIPLEPPVMVPYGELDNYLESMKSVDYFRIEAETTMETQFMPSLAQDKNQIAFILDTTDARYKKLLSNNLDQNNLPNDVVHGFITDLEEGRKLWAERNASGHNARISYVIFGLPPCMIQGILVGNKYEKDNTVLNHIKSVLPNCYICNTKGRVIVK